MKRIQFNVDERNYQNMRNMAEYVGIKTLSQFIEVALNLMYWAINEKVKGRSVVSMDEETGNYKELVLPFFAQMPVRPPLNLGERADAD